MQRKPLKQTKPLQKKTALNAKSPTAKPRKKLKTITALRKTADTYFSRYVRIRDSERRGDEFYGVCISCPNEYLVVYLDTATKWRFTNLVDNGHFVSRGHLIVRFDERNCNLQCKRCNKWLHGNAIPYKIALKLKYGDEIPGELEQLAEDNPTYNLKRDELEQVIADSKAQLEWYLNH